MTKVIVMAFMASVLSAMVLARPLDVHAQPAPQPRNCGGHVCLSCDTVKDTVMDSEGASVLIDHITCSDRDHVAYVYVTPMWMLGSAKDQRTVTEKMRDMFSRFAGYSLKIVTP
jgi:hypothetical protein